MDQEPHQSPLPQERANRSNPTPLLDGLLLDWNTTLSPLDKDRATSLMADLLLGLACQDPGADEID